MSAYLAPAVAAPEAMVGTTAKDYAVSIAEHFRLYNEEFGRITRRAARNFLAQDWHTAQLDAVERIELYEQRVARCVALVGSQLPAQRTDVALWAEIKRAYEALVARRPDGDFYNTFFNSVTRDLFGTVGVNREVEFCATSVGRASGSVPIRVYRGGAQRRPRIDRIDRARVLSRHACLRGRPTDRRRRHHASGARLHEFFSGCAGRRRYVVARRRGLAV